MWHVTFDMWHVTSDTWHMTSDTWNTGMMNIVSKFQVPSYNGLEVMIVWIYFHKGSLNQLINQWVTEVFVEQPWLHRVC